MDWYAALYADDPAPDNIFGREILAERQGPLLKSFLRQGGSLATLARAAADRDITAALDRALKL